MKIETGIARKIWPCNFADCRKKIGKGEKYLLWHKNGDALRQHTSHGKPIIKEATKKAAAKVTKKKATKGGKK